MNPSGVETQCPFLQASWQAGTEGFPPGLGVAAWHAITGGGLEVGPVSSPAAAYTSVMPTGHRHECDSSDCSTHSVSSIHGSFRHGLLTEIYKVHRQNVCKT